MKSHGKTRVHLTVFRSCYYYLNYFVQDFEIAQSVARLVCTFQVDGMPKCMGSSLKIIFDHIFYD